jgi:hypothetical protein
MIYGNHEYSGQKGALLDYEQFTLTTGDRAAAMTRSIQINNIFREKTVFIKLF